MYHLAGADGHPVLRVQVDASQNALYRVREFTVGLNGLVVISLGSENLAGDARIGARRFGSLGHLTSAGKILLLYGEQSIFRVGQEGDGVTNADQGATGAHPILQPANPGGSKHRGVVAP